MNKKIQQKQTKVFIALAACRDLTPQTHNCLMRDIQELMLRYYVVYSRFGNDALISRSRSRVCEEFLSTDSDVLIFIDADISWEPGDLARLVSSAVKTKGIIGSAISKREFGGGIASRTKFEANFRIGGDTLLESYYVGAAFMSIHREALEKIAEDCVMCFQGFRNFCMPIMAEHTDGSGRQEFLSEDWALCKRALDKGIPVYLDAMPVCGHTGGYTFTIFDAFDKRGMQHA